MERSIFSQPVTKLVARRSIRKACMVIASIVLPPILFLVLLGLPESVRLLPRLRDTPLELPVCLGVGFVFLFLEFRIMAIIFCWLYFGVMYWFTIWVVLTLAPLFYEGSYI